MLTKNSDILLGTYKNLKNRKLIMRALLLTAVLALSTSLFAQTNPVVEMETSAGSIKIELRPDLTPITVENFLRYVDNGYYDGLIFHRVISGFMIQGGGFDSDMVQKSTYDPIKNEADTGVSNGRGTIAMARTGVVDSATSQFFINLVNNGRLDYQNSSPSGYGYTAFGSVTEGMDVVDEIARVVTGSQRGYQNVPLEPITIISVTRLQ
jgi:cyclophilin family peptidyl-prolyl cis-trans isomerase